MLEHSRRFVAPIPTRRLRTRGMLRRAGRTVRVRRDQRSSCQQCRGSSPRAPQSEHPDYMPAAGAAFVASKIDAIAANPDVWAKTVFILNYDENDGIFDHVAPPMPPRGHAGRIRRRSAHRRRLPCALHHRLAVDGRRVGLQPAVRSHVGAAVPGEVHRRARTEHHRLAPPHVRRPHRRVSF